MGNICRSPTAEGVFRKIAEDHGWDKKNLLVDSAGTTGFHVGSPPDQRAIEAAKNRGYDLNKLRSRKFKVKDFSEFDLILTMDQHNSRDLIKQATESEHFDKIKLFLELSGNTDILEVPDPYYGSLNGFERVLDLVEEASHGLLRLLEEKYV